MTCIGGKRECRNRDSNEKDRAIDESDSFAGYDGAQIWHSDYRLLDRPRADFDFGAGQPANDGRIFIDAVRTPSERHPVGELWRNPVRCFVLEFREKQPCHYLWRDVPQRHIWEYAGIYL